MIAILAVLLGACSEGVLGAPCDVDVDCDDGLTCDVHEGGGSCQRVHAHSDPMIRDCSTETRDDDYSLGLTHAGAWAQVEFVAAEPSPPSRGDNTWTVRVRDQAATARADLTIGVSPFMPDHGHGSSVRCDVEAGEEPGTYVLTPVNFFMPGLWQVTLQIDASDEPEDDVMFSFCVDP
jgi:hypothetical protein